MTEKKSRRISNIDGYIVIWNTRKRPDFCHQTQPEVEKEVAELVRRSKKLEIEGLCKEKRRVELTDELVEKIEELTTDSNIMKLSSTVFAGTNPLSPQKARLAIHGTIVYLLENCYEKVNKTEYVKRLKLKSPKTLRVKIRDVETLLAKKPTSQDSQKSHNVAKQEQLKDIIKKLEQEIKDLVVIR